MCPAVPWLLNLGEPRAAPFCVPFRPLVRQHDESKLPYRPSIDGNPAEYRSCGQIQNAPPIVGCLEGRKQFIGYCSFGENNSASNCSVCVLTAHFLKRHAELTLRDSARS